MRTTNRMDRSLSLIAPPCLLAALLAGGCRVQEGQNRGHHASLTGASEAAVPATSSSIRFVEEARARGIDFVQFNGRSEEKFFVEVLGSGAIFFDADGDGDPDLYLLNQTAIVGKAPDPPPHSVFYVNDGTGHFIDATGRSGLGDAGYQLGVCGADIDNDGDIDLYVTRFDGANALYRNNGDLTFTDIAEQAGVAGIVATDSSCAFADVDGDGFVDLYVANYVDHTREHNIPCYRRLKATGERVREYCTPRHYNPVRDILYRNRGDGTFEDITEASGISSALGRSLGVAFADVDNDGDQDLYVACDRTASLFYENLGGGKFREAASRSGVALSQDGVEEAGMGVAWGDYDNDGWLDLVKTNYEAEMNNLYRNLGGLRFAEMTGPLGTGEPSFKYLAWGTGFFDADNDGDLDLFVANGHLRKDLDLYENNKGGLAGYEQYNLMFEQVDGKFISLGEAGGPALAIRKVSRGAAWADIDGDGDLDFIITNLHERPDLCVNVSPSPGHWLEVKCAGTKSNRSGIGARLTVESPQVPGRKLVREINSGQSYLSQSDLTAHFGLGSMTTVPRLTVRWPSGLVESFENLPADRIMMATEGRGIRPLSPERGPRASTSR